MKRTIKYCLLVLALAAFYLMAMGSGSSSSSSTAEKVGTLPEETESIDSAKTEDTKADENEADVPDKAYVGDVFSTGNLKIAYVSSGEFVSDNQFSQPEDGNKFIYIEVYFENISSDSRSVSEFDFECYADGYNAEQHYEDLDLSATLMPGKYTIGKVYFEVPKDVADEDVEIEYEVNFITEEKITFVYGGDKTSDFKIDYTPTATADAFKVGDIVETDDLRITYLSCEKTDSGNMYITPADGCSYYSLEFEVENISDSDQTITSYSFYGYADGENMQQSYFMDDDLSATLSAGRKAKGTVTFEVPDDAGIVEVEYQYNVWTGKTTVFTVR